VAVLAAIPTAQDRLYERRLIRASSLGNALEWFDFIIFGFLVMLTRRGEAPAEVVA
jgi:hypothetical protein